MYFFILCFCSASEQTINDEYYPMEVGRKWVMKSDTDEFTVKVAGIEKIGDTNCSKLVNTRKDKSTSMWLANKESGLFIYKYEETTFKEPLLFLKYPLKQDEKWSTLLPGTTKKVEVAVIGEEKVKTSLGEFNCIKIGFKREGVDNTMFLSRGIGLVRMVVKASERTFDFKMAILKTSEEIPITIKSKWVYDKFQVVVSGKEGDWFKIKHSDREYLVKSDFKGVVIKDPKGFSILETPLKVGTMWYVKELKASFEVTKIEEIKVPAGTFKATVVESKELKLELWYAKEVGFVKIKSGDTEAQLQRFESISCFCKKDCKCVHCTGITSVCYCDLNGCKCNTKISTCRCNHCMGKEGGCDGNGNCTCK